MTGAAGDGLADGRRNTFERKPMNPSATLCRSQEAYHRDRAAAEQLENVRIIAAQAAIAWRQEALAAERRETRQRKTKLAAEILALQKREAGDERDRLLSENPDRGFESPGAAPRPTA